IVRGVSILRTDAPEVAGNIRLKSVLGRFLEHNRLYYFRNGGQEECYLGSADLMPRNLDHRVEVLAPIDDPALLAYVRDELLASHLGDEAGAYVLAEGGRYRPPDGGFDAQAEFLDHHGGEAETAMPLTGAFLSYRDDLDS